MKTAILHRNQRQAERVVRELGLDGVPVGWGSSVAGARYDRVVVLGVPIPFTKLHQDWLDYSMKTSLTPGNTNNIVYLD